MASILVVEDEPLVLKVCAAILRSCGHRVLEAPNGLEALEVSDRADSLIDLALLDVVMPGMSGVELAKRLQITLPAIKIVLITAFPLEEVIRRTGALIPYPVARKPFNKSSLVRIIDDTLPDHRA